MIVPTPDRPSRTRGVRSERDLAIGLVLLALLAALLAHYALVLACRPDSPWPCRSSDVLRAQASATVAVTATVAAPVSARPLAFPTPRPYGTPSAAAQPGVFPSATEPVYVMPPTPAFPVPTEALVGVPTLASVMPSAQVLPTRGSAGIPFDQTPPTGTTAATAPAPGYP